jgi:sulfur carrier protein ThiS adenylyltransferase
MAANHAAGYPLKQGAIMKVFSFIGTSGSGKTRLVSRLAAEMKRRGLKVAAVKHCHHGFDLGGKEKDSNILLTAGADEVALSAPGRNVILREAAGDADLEFLVRSEFAKMDIVFVEGGKNVPGLRKVELFRKGVSEIPPHPRSDADAVVSDIPVSCRLPVFHPDEIEKLGDWLLQDCRKESESIASEREKEFFRKHDPAVLAVLRNSTIGIAGAGGLGSHAAVALARAGTGNLIVADFDRIELHNLNRQYYFLSQVGRWKVAALAENLKQINPWTTCEMHPARITPDNLGEIFAAADILLEAFDNAAQKQMLVETWLGLFPDKPVILASGLAGYGANDRLHQRGLGDVFICGDEAGECRNGVSPMAPRVAIVAGMQANLAVELLMRRRQTAVQGK